MTGPSRLLITLRRLNRTQVFLGALVLALLGLFVPGTLGALLLYAIVAALAALLSATWSVTPPGVRIFRLVVLAGLAAIATTKIV
jgi:hypothetical protein